VSRHDSAARLDAYEAVFTALAHPARRRVLLAVYFSGGTMSAGEIAATFSHAWQTTTRHLQVLERAGLLSCEKKGRMRIYRIDRKRLELVKDWLDQLLQETVGGNERCPGRRKKSRSFSD
jgi:DNA-binding transcriptional ArsR family regulator